MLNGENMVLLPPLLNSGIQIEIQKREFLPGEKISGKVHLYSENQIKARQFSISLVGKEWVNISCGSGKNRRGKTEEKIIHSQQVIFGGEKEYTNFSGEFSFEIPKDAPPTIDRNPPIQEGPVSTISAVGSIISNTLVGKRDEENFGAGLRWSLIAKLDIPWSFDMVQEEKLFIQ